MSRPRAAPSRPRFALALTLTLALVLGLLLGSVAGIAGVGTGTAVAGDRVATVWTEPERVAVEPGETVDLEVVLRSEGGHGDAGVEAVTLVAQYHPDYLEVTDVERGPWLEGGAENGSVEITTAGTVAHENGTAILEQRREDGDGATGVGTIATLSVRVAEDAPAATTEIAFDATDVTLESEWPTAVVDEPTVVTIDDGDESAAQFDHPDPDELSLEEGFGTAQAGTSGAADASGAGDSEESDGAIDSVPGYTGPLAVGVIVALAVAVVARRRGSIPP